MADNRYRTSIQFNLNDVDQRQALNFLSRCGRRKNKIMAIAICELMEKYGLSVETIDNKELSKFLIAYPYMKKKAIKITVPADNRQRNDVHGENSGTGKTGGKTVPDKREKTNKALAAFGL